MNTTPNMVAPENPPVSSEGNTADSTLWTTTEVSRYLHVSAKTVFNLRKRGLPCVYLGGAVRFVPQEIKDYLIKDRGLTFHRMRQVIRKGRNQ